MPKTKLTERKIAKYLEVYQSGGLNENEASFHYYTSLFFFCFFLLVLCVFHIL